MFAKKIPAVFFAHESGAEPVRDWLKTLSRADQKQIGDDIRLVEFGWPIGMPVCRPLGKGLYEVRTNLKGRIARVLFAVEDGRMILLHAFIKKSQTAPDDIALGRARLKTVRHGEQ